MKLNKKILTLMLVFGVCATAAVAQITVVTGDNIKKSEPIDELVFRAQYELKMLEDTTRSDSKPNSETMMLEVGKKSSLFYGYTTYLRDSVLMEDVKNNVSQELMAEHTSAYGNARITYRIYKNHPAGKVTTLDRIVTTNFRCEEKNDLQAQESERKQAVQKRIEGKKQRRERNHRLFLAAGLLIEAGLVVSHLPG